MSRILYELSRKKVLEMNVKVSLESWSDNR